MKREYDFSKGERGLHHIPPDASITVPAPKKKRGRPEAQLADQVVAFLALDGWRAVKMEPLSGRGVASRIIAAVEKLPIPAGIKAKG